MVDGSKIKMVMSHPNFLTLFRIAAVPAIVILMIFPNRFFTLLAAALFSAAALTDYLDGYFARRQGLETTVTGPLIWRSFVVVRLSNNVGLGGRGWTERQRGKPRGFGLAPSNPDSMKEGRKKFSWYGRRSRRGSPTFLCDRGVTV